MFYHSCLLKSPDTPIPLFIDVSGDFNRHKWFILSIICEMCYLCIGVAE